MAKTHCVLSTLLLVGGLNAFACSGKSAGTKACGEGGIGSNAAGDCGVEQPPSPLCVEARVEGELSSPDSMPPRPLWADENGLHVVYVDRQRGIVRATLSPETGQQTISEADAVFPADLDKGYSATGVDAIATSPQADMAISFGWMSRGFYFKKILLIAGEKKTIWDYPWIDAYSTMGLGWDGEGFTTSLLDSTGIWATARFTPQGEMLADAQEFGQAAVNYGQYDVETDPENGTTVFVTGYSPGVVVAGRYGRNASLTAPEPYWLIDTGVAPSSGLTPAVALHGDVALIASSDVDHGIFAREVSLPGGQASEPWVISTDPGNLFKHLAAAWAKDHWVVVGQDYRGLVLAEIGSQGVKQMRLLSHAPAICAATNACPSNSSDWKWRAEFVSVVTYGGAAWVGLVDMTSQRVKDAQALFTYRILPLRADCTFQSVGLSIP